MYKGDGSTLIILLVDSEALLPAEHTSADSEPSDEIERRERRNAEDRRDHLFKRDRWDLKGIDVENIHLMVTCMETWIVADPAALSEFYKQGFRPGKLPQRQNLEEEPKQDLYAKLAEATKDTIKKAYTEKNNSKIKHASKLLAMIDPEKVAVRCPRFKTFTAWLDRQIRDARLH
nr:DUF4276 family protein [Aquisphaera insulae]